MNSHFEPDPPVASVAAPNAPSQYPCTRIQERFLALQRMVPDSAIANVAMRWRLLGSVRDASIEAALQALVERHEVLGTRLTGAGDDLHQEVTAAKIKLSVVDISRLKPDLAQNEIARISALEARRPFDPGVAPLLRATVLRLTPTEAIVLLTFHHAVIDGWAVGIIARELASLLDQQESGKAARLPEIELAYGDYALWQREALASPAMDEDRAFWRRQLAGVTFFEVPHPGRPRPDRHSGDAGIRSILLPRSATDRLQAHARREGTTLFTTTTACLALVLAEKAGRRDVTMTTPVACRDDPLLHELVGPVVNSVCLRLETPDSAEDFPEFLRQCRATVAEAFDHKDLPFEEVLAATGIGNLPGHPFAFGVNVTLQAANIDSGKASSIKVGGVELVSIPSVTPGSLYDLNFFMVERAEGWRISCEYNADIYTAEDTDGLLEAWRSAMERAATRPEPASHTDKTSTAPVVARSRPVDAIPSAADRLDLPVVATREYFQTFPLQPLGQLPPVFAFNNRSAYYPVARHFGTERPFVDIQWRGEAELPPLGPNSIPDIAADAARKMREYDPDGPYYIMGHCMMGIVAFETARQVRLAGGEVAGIFLLDTLAPGYVETMPWHDRVLRRVQLLGHSAKSLVKLVGMVRDGEIGVGGALLHYSFIRNNRIVKLFTGRGSYTAQQPERDIMNHGLMTYLRDAKSLYNYEVYPGDVCFFRSEGAHVGRLFARGFGWKGLVSGDFRVYDVPGGHLEMTRDPGASVIAEHMQWLMDRREGRWDMPKSG